ncbi:hypothetical protein C808_02580 [Lachnospiraceae bacterium M18-1]|nr:hypothetical protein C808_02580 [Lachnospiraceae bacterium M18-1]
MLNLRDHFITTERPYKEGTVEVFEQHVQTSKIEIEKAILSITALGLYEAELNGQKVGDVMFAPGYTYYPHNLHYQTYDITTLLHEQNALRVYLGQGWYCGRFTYDSKTQIYGERPAVAWIFEVTYTNGTISKHTSTDKDVTVIPSPYAYAGFYDGEVYNENAQLPTYPPVPFLGKLPKVIEKNNISVKVQEKMPIHAVIHLGDTTILDFGQNFAGLIEINPVYMKSDVLTLRHGEILNTDGSLYTTNLRNAKAQIIYHKSTSGKKYRPRFTYMGFRYVELTGCEYIDGILTAYALHSEMERTGYFKCENAEVQRLYENQIWSQKSNYVEIPTDCPQRDERMGYTGDGHVFALTGAYNFDTEKFWSKFLKDIRYSQSDNTENYVAAIVPALGPEGIGFVNMLGWGNAVTIIPKMLWWQYGTDRYLKEQYESMKAHIDCEIRHMGEKDLWIAPNLGDWLTLGKDIRYMAIHNGPVSNAFIINDLRIICMAATRLGNNKDAQKYNCQLERCLKAYIKTFVDKDGKMLDPYQGAYVMALRFVIPKSHLWNQLFANLVADIHQNGLQTGFFATEHLLPLLADNGETKLAYDLLLQPTCPGWMYQVRHDATTIWERWDAIQPDGSINETDQNGNNMVSFNHYAFGSVGEFYYRYILGIQPAEPGYTKIKIAPIVDERLGKVKGSYQSRAGKIEVAWQISNSTAIFSILTPSETELILPDGNCRQLSPGRYTMDCRI